MASKTENASIWWRHHVKPLGRIRWSRLHPLGGEIWRKPATAKCWAETEHYGAFILAELVTRDGRCEGYSQYIVIACYSACPRNVSSNEMPGVTDPCIWIFVAGSTHINIYIHIWFLYFYSQQARRRKLVSNWKKKQVGLLLYGKGSYPSTYL